MESRYKNYPKLLVSFINKKKKKKIEKFYMDLEKLTTSFDLKKRNRLPNYLFRIF